jgi:hypothetical protein
LPSNRGALYISECDQFFRFVQAGYIESWKPESHEQITTVMRIVAQAAAGYEDAGYFTIIDGIVIPGWFLQPLRDSLRAAGRRVAYAVLRAPLAVCIERTGSRASSRRRRIERLWHDSADTSGMIAFAVSATCSPSHHAGRSPRR